MLSLIICSTHKQLPTTIYNNIKDTVHVPYEIIVIDNSQNRHSIFSAYNEGVQMAHFPYLCFMHEDIMFRTDNVGEIITRSFENNKSLGVLGVIGITVLPKLPFGWWSAGYDYYRGGILSNTKRNKMLSHYRKVSENEKEPILKDVVACDGLFLCLRKETFKHIMWDEKTFDGFHCYDLDICMQILKLGMKVNVAENIIIEHYSTGSPTEKFAEGCWLFHKKWQEMLPVYTEDMERTQVAKIQESVYRDYLRSYPLAIRYKHISCSKIGSYVLSLMKAVKNIKAKAL